MESVHFVELQRKFKKRFTHYILNEVDFMELKNIIDEIRRAGFNLDDFQIGFVHIMLHNNMCSDYTLRWRTMRLFLDNGASPNQKIIDGTPFICHILKENLWYNKSDCDIFNMFDILLEYGADINVQNAGGNTPLHLVIGMDKKHSAVEYFISRGCNVNIKNGAGLTPLMCLLQKYSYYHHYSTSSDKNNLKLRLLLDAGSNLSICDGNGDNALHYISKIKHIQLYCIFQEYF
jgi:ankyrin repeat protein